MPIRVRSSQNQTALFSPSWPWYENGTYYVELVTGPMPKIPGWPTWSQGVVCDPVQGAYALCPIGWGRATNISGSVLRQRITGIARDSDGNPIAGAVIKLLRTTDDVYVGTATSGSDGRYTIIISDESLEYYAVAYKSAATDRAGTTINGLVGESG